MMVVVVKERLAVGVKIPDDENVGYHKPQHIRRKLPRQLVQFNRHKKSRYQIVQTPEPVAIGVFGVAGAAMLLRRRRRGADADSAQIR